MHIDPGISEWVERLKENKRWNRLIDAILAGDVIPVVGSDFLIETENDGVTSFPDHHKQLTDVLAQICEVPGDVADFSQLIYHPEFNKWTDGNPDFIYPLISEVLLQLIEQRTLQPSHLLMKLLETRLFPFVITTSFSPVIEYAMREAWGREQVRVLQYRNDSKRDLTAGIGDISCEAEMLQPTVYYMFGKCSAEPHRFVVSDLDMMDFCKSWLAGGNKVPRMLTEVLKKKYLLVLGNNYSDWLFRFVSVYCADTPGFPCRRRLRRLRPVSTMRGTHMAVRYVSEAACRELWTMPVPDIRTFSPLGFPFMNQATTMTCIGSSYCSG